MASAPATPPAAPPRFVPTLTEEVSLPAEAALDEPRELAELPDGYELPAGEPEAGDEPDEETARESELADGAVEKTVFGASAADLPAHVMANLPELTEVAPDLPDLPEQALGVTHAVQPPLPDGYEEVVIHRVMQRVDVMLEQRLAEAISRVIQEQTRSIVPRLREEVESVVRQSVYEAVADELACGQK